MVKTKYTHGLDISRSDRDLRRLYPKPREHLGATAAFMKISRDYRDFIEKMDTHYPRFGEQYRLSFEYVPEKDDGRGI